ncbi:MAG TPA: acetyl-CoA C-acyltransferase [Planctomycetia bacterium]|nr:acetyl-CoA C-acyltransferase [Planctomycetia bacterium]
MREAFILSAARTPIGKFRGALSSVGTIGLGAHAIAAAVRSAGVAPAEIEEAIMGCVLPAGLGQAPARQAALKGGLSPQVAALTINKVCGSGLKAISLAAQAIRAGDVDLAVAGGMECMSQAARVLPRDNVAYGDWTLLDTMAHDGLTCAMSKRVMGDIAESVAEKYGISRAEQDKHSFESHRRAAAAIAEGAFADEIAPLSVAAGKGEKIEVSRDEGPRADSTVEKLGTLKPAFRPTGTVTAGNASMISDGAAAAVVASGDAAKRLGAKPLAWIVASATSGGAPEDLFTAPIEAVRKVLKKAGKSLGEIGLFEINEAFAVQTIACMKALEIPHERVNVHGGAIGASGARVLTTLVHALGRRKEKLGVATLCLGGGNAVAMLIERLDG